MGRTADGLSCSETSELQARARQGDADAFCRLAELHESRLLRQACGMAGNLSVAEDLVAETLVEAWRSIARYNGTCRFSTWLFSILLHRHQKHIRHAKSRPIPMSSLPVSDSREYEQSYANLPGNTPSPGEELVQKEASEKLRQVLDRMPEKYRQVLLLRFFEEASLDEIAALVGCPVGTVKSRLHYALDALRKTEAGLNLG